MMNPGLVELPCTKLAESAEVMLIDKQSRQL